jgi:hypothetical protein
MEWTGLAAAITSLAGIATIIFYIKDNSRYRRERQSKEDEFSGQLKQRLDNIDSKLEKQEQLCSKERKSIWDRVDECSDGVAFLKGKLNSTPHP